MNFRKAVTTASDSAEIVCTPVVPGPPVLGPDFFFWASFFFSVRVAVELPRFIGVTPDSSEASELSDDEVNRMPPVA